MLGGERPRYCDDVAVLVPAFGFTREEAGPMKALSALDIARQQNYWERAVAASPARSDGAGRDG